MKTNYVHVIVPMSDCPSVGVIGFTTNDELNEKLKLALESHFCENVTFDPVVREFKTLDIDGLSMEVIFEDGSTGEVYIEPTVLY